jgi:Uma2 family endonuclease
MAETDVHRDAMLDMIAMLRQHFASEPDVYVSGNLLLYYQEGDPRQSVAPDVFVVRGVPNHQRRTYRVWMEGKGPDWVLELTSRSTQAEDLGAKRGLYEWLGVQEYVLFDPLGEYLDSPLQGFTLVNGRFEPVPLSPDGALPSNILGLELHRQAERLRLWDPAAQRWLLTPAEEVEARRQAEVQAAQAQTQALTEAEARRRAETEAEQARARASAEAQARQQAEAELARLRAEVERLRRPSAE